MNRKQVSEEEKSRYRKGCLTGLAVALALIVLSSGISQVTSYRTNPGKSADFMYEYKCDFPKECTEKDILIHVSNNNFITVKTNLEKTGEGLSDCEKIKNHILETLRRTEIKGSGIKIVGKNNITVYDSTTKQ